MSSSKHLSCDGHFDFVMNMLVKQRNSGDYCDVTLVAEGQKFPAHRAILAASSKYFHTMFKSQMKEQFEKEITIKEATKIAMKQVINFIYTNKVLLSEENIDEVLHAASLMQVQDLLALVIQYLSDEISPMNCLHYRQLGILYSLNDLVSECDRCIRNNFDQVSSKEELLGIDEVEMEKLISSDELVVESEEVVYECLVGWVKHDLHTRKQYFPTLFKHLRLQYVGVDYLSKNIRKEELVREFLDCRDLVEDAFYFHIKPDMFEKQKQRKRCYPCKDITFVPNGQRNIACFNVSEQEWSSLKVKGVYHDYAMFIVHDEMVYCFGYINENSFNFGSNISKRFNGIEWENLAPMINCHYEAAVASIQGGIFVFGGLLIEAQSNVAYATNRISKYNPTNNTWTDVGHTKTLLSKAAAVGVGNVAYICGGHEQANGGQRNLCAGYKQVNRRQRKKKTDAYSRGGYEYAMAVQSNLPTDRRYGGHHPANVIEKNFPTDMWYDEGEVNDEQINSTTVTAKVEMYDSIEKTWKVGNNMIEGRASCAAVHLDGKIFVFGGFGSNNTLLTSGEFMNIADGVWTMLTNQIPFQLGGVSACCVGHHVAMYGSFKPGHIVLYNFKKDEWETFVEEGQNLFNGRGCLMAK